MLLTPLVPALVLYAAIATVFGEELLEAENRSTWLGQLVLVTPNAIGAVLAIAARPLGALGTPSGRAVLATLAVLGSALLALAFVGSRSSVPGDPNIGAGLLALAGIALITVSAVSAGAARLRSTAR